MTDTREDLRAELRRHSDIEEIKQLKARYVRFADNKQWDEWGALLTDDFYFDSDGGVQEGRDNVVAFVSKSLAEASTVHHIFTPEITFTDDDAASAIWPMEDWVHLTYDGKSMAFHGCGYYREEYVRTAEGWRLRRTEMSRLRVDPIVDPKE